MRITIINIYNRAPKYMKQKLTGMETSLVVQWLGLCTFTAVSLGSIPGQGTKIPQVAWHGKKKKNLTGMKGQTGNSTITVVDFNIPLSLMIEQLG